MVTLNPESQGWPGPRCATSQDDGNRHHSSVTESAATATGTVPALAAGRSRMREQMDRPQEEAALVADPNPAADSRSATAIESSSDTGW